MSGTLPHRLLFDNQTFATYLAYWGEPRTDPLGVSITLTVEGTPVAHDLLGGARAAAADFARDAADPAACVPRAVDRRTDADRLQRGAVDVFGERSGVTRRPQLSVAEVIARHQARQRAQDALVRNYIARARMEQHFRPTIADPGYDVVTENRYFVDRRRRRVGGAVVLRQRIDAGEPIARRFRCCSRRRCCRCRCSCGSTTATGIGWTARRASTATTATSCASSRSGATRRCIAARSGSIGKTFARDPRPGGAERAAGAGRVERGDPGVHAAGDGRRTSRCSC